MANILPLPMRDDAVKSDREQPEIDRGHNDFECRVHIFSSCDWIHAAPCGMFLFSLSLF
ncbi:TPA: hypothetical protein QHN61_000795 [Escherichia coli]|uniref:hypothetical protein n=1 Tax=Escherichia coli TaxID=562 RepID=UPI0019683E78|nr:hypothetical protein [Escherichia coli]MCT9816756.1 hypothetical protein [Escherichia coli]HDT4142636.1 hypothetical protein [Escherichia coli]